MINRAIISIRSAFDMGQPHAGTKWQWHDRVRAVPSHAAAVALIAAMIAGYASRLITPPTLWFDEAMLLVNVRDIDWSGVFRPLPLYDQVAPMGYVALLKAIFTLGGLNEALLRLPSLLALAGAIWLAALLPETTRTVRVVTAAVIAGSFVVARAATDAKPYTFDIACAMALIVAFHPASRGWITSSIARFALLACAMMLATSFPIVAAATCAPALMLQLRADMASGRPLRGWAFWRLVAPIAAALSLYLIYFTAYIGPALKLVSANHHYLTRLGFAGDGDIYPVWLAGQVNAILASHAGDIAPCVIVASGVGLASLIRARSVYAGQFAALAAAVIALNLAGRFPILEERFSIYLLPWVGLAVGAGVCRLSTALSDARAKGVVAAVATAALLWPATGTISDPFHQTARRSLARLAADPAPVFGAQPILDLYLGRGPDRARDCMLAFVGDATNRCTAARGPHDGAFEGRATKWYLMNYIAAGLRGGATPGLDAGRLKQLTDDYVNWVAAGIVRHKRAYYLAIQAEKRFMAALMQRLSAHGTFRLVVDERPQSPTYAHGAGRLYLFERRAR
ncbi:MAG: hypothetical protein KDJ36_07605 [Hyphomicrobiaceae bacterium]|nr:hypothetical protein [Hyphomicrobiaceae bacterium]